MNRIVVFVLLAAATVLGTEGLAPTVPTDQAPLVTFNKDVLPILQENCQVCHRPGSVAPMSFVTYESARPWAKAIKAAVLGKKMPPWFADPHIGEFRNAPKLNASDITTLAAWADGGAHEGNAADRPAAPEWKEGWRIQPDVVVSIPQPYRVAAKGEGEVRQFVVESPFKEDTWVSAIEIRPGDPSVVHHVIVQIPEQEVKKIAIGGLVAGAGIPSATVCGDCPENSVAQRQLVLAQQAEALRVQTTVLKEQLEVTRVRANVAQLNGQLVNFVGQRGFGGGGGTYSDLLVRLRERQTGEGAFTTMEAVYAPGTQPIDFRYSNSAKLIPGGKPIRIEVHYTPNGKETLDQTKVGFTLAKTPAERRFVMMAPEHLVDDRIPIPAGEANWETTGELTFKQDADLVWFMPHMHLRGKDMTFRLIHPDGREETVLSAKFSFNWQLGYEVEKPIKIKKGTRMIVTAHHDNSANNPSNPTPGQAVTWGEMTAQEMMLPWFGVIVDRNATPEMIASYKPGNLEGPFPQQGPGAARKPDMNEFGILLKREITVRP